MDKTYNADGTIEITFDESDNADESATLIYFSGLESTFLSVFQPFQFKTWLKEKGIAPTNGVQYVLKATVGGTKYTLKVAMATLETDGSGNYEWTYGSDLQIDSSITELSLYLQTNVYAYGGGTTTKVKDFIIKGISDPVASVDPSNAKTLYIRESESDTSFDTAGAKFLVDGNEITNSSVHWVKPTCDPKITGNYQITGSKDLIYAIHHFGSSSAVSYCRKTVSASYTVTSKPFSIASVTKAGSDTNSYFEQGTTWKVPTYTSFTITYTSGKTVSLSPSDSKVTYWHDAERTVPMDGREITKDDNVAHVYIEMGDFIGNYCSFTIELSVVDIDVTSVSASGSFILSNTPKSQKDKITLLATYSNGATKSVEYGDSGWYFASPDSAYSDSAKPLAVYVTCNGREYGTFDISGDLTFSQPSVASVEIIEGSRTSTAIVNNTSIDLTGTILRVTYDGKDGYEDIPFSDGNVARSGCFIASCEALSGKASKFDGSEDFDAELGESASKEYSIILSGTDSFGNAVTATLKVTVYMLTDILGLSLKQAKTDYKVGESFLNSSDDTKVRVWFSSGKDSNGYDIKKFIDMPLRSAFSSLTVHPSKGTVFSSIGSVEVRVSSVFDTSKYVTYTLAVERNVRLSTDTTTEAYRFVKLDSDWSYETENGTCELKSGTYVKLNEGDTETALVAGKKKRRVISGKTLATSYKQSPLSYALIHGYLDSVGDKDSNAVLVDFNDYVPPISGASNMTVKFPCYQEDSSSFVDGCTFGVRFGHNNSLNRLFVSGNPKMPNYDIHSVEPNSTNEDEASQVREGDFSYFPDEAMCRYGESENSIVGYDVVSDSKLLVLKDRSGKEKTIYFRVPTTVSMLDSSGTVLTDVSGNALTQEEYSVYMSNSSVAGISHGSIANFNGDTVFVDDDNEIAGLDIEGIIGDSQRQANSRSHYIDGKLREFDLSNANLESYGRYLILDIPGVAAFVTDRESKSNAQYEWWRLDSLDSTCFMELNGVLYYGSSDGSLCRLSEDYSDKETRTVEVALGQLDYDNDLVVGFNDTDFIEGDHEYTWRTFPKDLDDCECYIYARLLDCGEGGEAAIDASNNWIKVDDEALRRKLNSSLKLYMTSFVKPTEAIQSNYGKAYRLIEQGYASGIYKIVGYSDFEELTLSDYSDGGLRLCLRLDGEIPVRKYKEGEIRLYEGEESDSKQYDLVPYAGQTTSFRISGKLTRWTPISTRLVSSPLLISSANWFKHVVKLDITQGTDDVSDIMVAYCNNRMPYIVEDSVKDRGQTMDLGDFSFSDVDFSSNFYTRTYTIGRELKAIKYICVAFASDRDMNSVVPSVSLTYVYSRLSRGVGE